MFHTIKRIIPTNIINRDFQCEVGTVLLLLLLLLFTIMQVIYNYIPEKIYVSRVFSVAVILCLQFMLQVKLFRLFNVLYIYISTFRSM